MGLGIQTFVFGQSSFNNLSGNGNTSLVNRIENINDDNNKRKTVDAQNLNVSGNDVVSRQVFARREALKSIMDTFADDLSMDHGIDGMRQKAEALNSQAQSAYDQQNRIFDLKKELKNSMGVADDSKEQNDLELLEKKRSLMETGETDKLTDDERERLSSMGPLTEYQQMALQYDDMANYWGKVAGKALNEKKSIGISIDNIKIERSKNHEIVDSGKKAEAIMDEASKDLVTSNVASALESINDRFDITDEDKDDNKDKSKKDSEDNIKDIISEENMAAVRRTASNMVANNLMTFDDIKGINMDEVI